MPSRNKPKPAVSNGNLEAEESSKSMSFTANEVLLLNSEESKAKIKSNPTTSNSASHNNNVISNNQSVNQMDYGTGVTPVRLTVFSINSPHESQNVTFIPKEDEGNNVGNYNDLDQTSGEITTNFHQNLPQEKKNLAEIFKTKILKINSVNLCNDFVNFIDLNTIEEITTKYNKIKVRGTDAVFTK